MNNTIILTVVFCLSLSWFQFLAPDKEWTLLVYMIGSDNVDNGIFNQPGMELLSRRNERPSLFYPRFYFRSV